MKNDSERRGSEESNLGILLFGDNNEIINF